MSVHCDDFSWPISLALFKNVLSNTQILMLKCGLYPRIDSSSIRLGMIYAMDAYGCWGKRHNFGCSLGIVKISIYLYHPGKKKHLVSQLMKLTIFS